jgi:hypothetical protein
VKAVYDYLMSIDLTDYNPRDIERTDAELEMMRCEKPSHERWLINLATNNPDVSEMSMLTKDRYDSYSDFCRMEDILKMSSVNFGRKMVRFMDTSPKIITTSVKRGRSGRFHQTINLDAVREYFKIMVDDNDAPLVNVRVDMVDDNDAPLVNVRVDRVDDNDAPLVNESVLMCDFENIDLSR